MQKLSKEKILGQYFSGDKIPKLLVSLLQICDIHNAIDPMCGNGDMFAPFKNSDVNLFGIELDSDVAQVSRARFPNAALYNDNAFNPSLLSHITPESGFDLVITNPPFVRRELLNPIKSNGVHQDLDTIKKGISDIIDNIKHISAEDRAIIKSTLSALSKYTDLSILSWMLCIALLRYGGQLALVVPTSWMTREYAKPLVRLMNQLFKIEYIIVDSNRIWFDGSAQVQTSLVVARRKYPNVSYIHDSIKYVNLYGISMSHESLIGNIPSNVDFFNYINTGHSYYPYFEVTSLPQEQLILDNASFVSNKSKLSIFIDNATDDFSTIEHFGINIGQGLRTGANKFFYLKKEDDYCISSIYNVPLKYNQELFKYVIQRQDFLTDSYAITSPPNEVLLYIQDSVIAKDRITSIESYNAIPSDVEEYITFGENYCVNGTTIPNLSAVKTNVRISKRGTLPRFWYMLPKASNRHYAHIFIPRINNKNVVCRLNNTDKTIFIDANFSCIWRDNSCPLNDYAIFALFNSKWAKIQYEENGTIMGGGALKLDVVQLKKTIFPTSISNYSHELDVLGKELINSNINTSNGIISKIDSYILRAINIESSPADAILTTLLNQYLQCRN